MPAFPPGQILLLDFAGAPGFLDPAITFTRASARSFVNEFGMVKQAPANAPAWTYDPATGESLGICNEDAATNLALYSEQFDNAAWTKTSATIGANATTAPDGNTTADSITLTGAGAVSQAVTITTGYSLTASAWVKAFASSFAYIEITDGAYSAGAWFNLSTGAVGTTVAGGGSCAFTRAKIKAFPNGWYRCAITALTAAGTSFTVKIAPASADNVAPANTNSIYAWGAQAEAPGTIGAVTSYIATTSASATRAADLISMPTSASWLNPEQGTLFFAGAIDDTALAATSHLLALWDGTTSNAIVLAKNASNAIAASVAVAGVEQVPTLTSGTMAAGTTKRVALSYKANAFAMSVDGAAYVLDRDGSIPSVNALRIGRRDAGVNGLSGTVRAVGYLPFAVSTADLQSLTA